MTNVPGGFGYVQQEALQYNRPVSEASLDSLGSAINGLLSVALPVGSVVDSLLTESQFQTQIGSPNPATWILADGRDVTGSLYNLITGNTTIPDFRGLFRRGKNNGRSDGNQNPDGDLALGTFTSFEVQGHTHGYQQGGGLAAVGSVSSGPTNFGAPANTGTTDSSGGDQTAPANITVNTFIRIN